MTTRTLFKAMIVAAALAGCAPLSAEAPLFSTADQIGPAPLTEGIWIQISEDCPARMARRRGRLPAACAPGELRRLPDEAWSYKYHVPAQQVDSAAEPAHDIVLRLIIAPATEHPSAEAYAPLYLAEYTPLAGTEPSHPHYAAIAPVGALPATAMYVVAEIGCDEALRDGPIEGLRELTNESGERTACIASSQAAVREAARRAIIENLDHIEDHKLVFVRP